MAADLNGDVAPIGIQDVKGVVVHVGHRGLALEVMVGADVPHRGPSAADQNQKQPAGDLGLGQVFLGKVVLALSDRTVDDRNAVGFGIAAHATAETACHAHQVGVVQRVIRSGQRPPPQTEPAGTMPHREISIQHDPVHAIVAAAQQILVQSAQPIHDGGHATSTAPSISNCPEGATFSQPGLRKSVGP